MTKVDMVTYRQKQLNEQIRFILVLLTCLFVIALADSVKADETSVQTGPNENKTEPYLQNYNYLSGADSGNESLTENSSQKDAIGQNSGSRFLYTDGLPEHQNLPEIPHAVMGLGLKLIGTVLTDEPEGNIAIIENVGMGEQLVYKEGDVLEGVQIKRILSRSIIIDEGNGDTILVMKGADNTDNLHSQTQRVQLEKEVVDATVPSYSSMMRTIRIRPYRKGGRPGGVMIYNIKPDSIFARMGLENGDVITAVKGKSITLTRQTADFYNALRLGGEVTLDIKRGEASQELRFIIK